MRGFEHPQKLLGKKGVSSWHCNFLCYTRRSKEASLRHIVQAVLHGISEWVALITQRARLGKPNCPRIPESRQRFWSIDLEGHSCSGRKHHHIMSYQKMKEAMLSFVMDPALWLGTIRGGKLLCGVPHNELLRPLKEKKSGLYCVSILTPGWWLQQWKKTNWQCRGKPIWAAVLWQGITARIGNTALKERHVDA